MSNKYCPSKQELIEHIQTLNGLIDGEEDSLGEMLTPIVAMLEKMVGPLLVKEEQLNGAVFRAVDWRNVLAIGIHRDTGFVVSRRIQVPMTIEGISPVIVQPDKAAVAKELAIDALRMTPSGQVAYWSPFDTYLLVHNDQVVLHWDAANVDTQTGQ